MGAGECSKLTCMSWAHINSVFVKSLTARGGDNSSNRAALRVCCSCVQIHKMLETHTKEFIQDIQLFCMRVCVALVWHCVRRCVGVCVCMCVCRRPIREIDMDYWLWFFMCCQQPDSRAPKSLPHALMNYSLCETKSANMYVYCEHVCVCLCVCMCLHFSAPLCMCV